MCAPFGRSGSAGSAARLDLLAAPRGWVILAGAHSATVYSDEITRAISLGHVVAQEAEQRLGVAL